jgi:membrane fusion protein, multidrug efflux system
MEYGEEKAKAWLKPEWLHPSPEARQLMSRPTPEAPASDPAEALRPVRPGAAAPTEVPPDEPPSRRKWWLYAVIVLVLAVAGLYWLRTRPTSAAAKEGKAAGSGPTPVVAAKAVAGNIGVYVMGLGAITPIYTVTIKSRVDGQLMGVHFKEGDLVNQGDPLIEIDPRPYEAVVVQVQGQLLRDQALLANARVDLTRYETLVTTSAIPEQQLATQKALVTQYEGTVENDQGLLDAAKLNVTYCHITAPITGVVGLRLVDPGNIIQATDTNGMLVIAQVQPISAIFTVGEDQLAPILQRIRAHEKLAVDAWDREQKHKLATGYLDTVDNLIDQTTGTLKLRAIFDNPDLALFPNQFVNARLLLQEKTGVTLLPTAAIQRNTNDTYVYLVKPDNAVTIRSVKVGTMEGDQSEITSGLSRGDVVVMTGVDKLQEGSKVAFTLNSAK